MVCDAVDFLAGRQAMWDLPGSAAGCGAAACFTCSLQRLAPAAALRGRAADCGITVLLLRGHSEDWPPIICTVQLGLGGILAP